LILAQDYEKLARRARELKRFFTPFLPEAECGPLNAESSHPHDFKCPLLLRLVHNFAAGHRHDDPRRAQLLRRNFD